MMIFQFEVKFIIITIEIPIHWVLHTSNQLYICFIPLDNVQVLILKLLLTPLNTSEVTS
jgi:hypothetical protein